MAESKIPKEWGKPLHGKSLFTMHSVREYERMSNEPYFPAYLRLWFFAVANVKPNGHLPLKRGSLLWALGEDVDGVRQPVDSKTVQNAIALAKEKGLLDPESGALCLRPARSIVVQGDGSITPCDRCDRGQKPRAAYLRSVS